MQALNVTHIIQGQEDKLPALIQLTKQLNINLNEVAYIGDDVPDLACIEAVGLGICVADGHPLVLRGADYTTFTRGGFGAVRETCDLIMQNQGSLTSASGASI
jgi:3-deoxy-D-manno-octulosonate 8-phosphate phosphatase (KDO 8-P phosphatase)